MIKLSDLKTAGIYLDSNIGFPYLPPHGWKYEGTSVPENGDYNLWGDYVEEYKAPLRFRFLEEKIDSMKNSVVLEFLLAGLEKHEISVKVSKEKQQIIISKTGLDVPLVVESISNRKDLDISDKISSVLKNGILTISIPILEKEKDLEVKIQ